MKFFDKFKKKDKKEKKVDEKKSIKVDDVKKESKIKKISEDKKQPEKKAVSQEKKTKGISNVSGVLIKPLITEKATNLSQFNQYVFEVSVRANKIQIAHAIEERYNIKPVKVNVLNNLGRNVRYGKSQGRTKAWKKAIVILPEGKTIKIHEGV